MAHKPARGTDTGGGEKWGEKKTLACRALLSIKDAKAFFLVASTAFISVWGWGNDERK